MAGEGRWFLHNKECALLVIDMQERLLAAMREDDAARTVKNTGILVDAAHVFGIPIIASEQYRKGLGPTVPPLAERLSGTPILEKLHFSCMRDDGLANAVRGTGRRVFILAGIETHVCVFQTSLDMLSAGYSVVVASDAVSSRRDHDREYALRALDRAGALVYPTETICFMLMERAGTEVFRKLAPLFK